MKPREYVFPTQFGEYLAARARRVWVAMDRISEPQHRKIDEAIRSDFDRFANTDLFKAIQLDVEMFGRAAFRKSVRK